MNHSKVILDVLAKYSDFPSVQKDMRKLLGYIESQQRMFISATLKTEPTAPSPRTIASILATYSAPIRKSLEMVIESVVLHAATSTVNGIKSPNAPDALTDREIIDHLTSKHYDVLLAAHGDNLPVTLLVDLGFIVADALARTKAAANSLVDDLISGAIRLPGMEAVNA